MPLSFGDEQSRFSFNYGCLKFDQQILFFWSAKLFLTVFSMASLLSIF
jgi:hypothetical protein